MYKKILAVFLALLIIVSSVVVPYRKANAILPVLGAIAAEELISYTLTALCVAGVSYVLLSDPVVQQGIAKGYSNSLNLYYNFKSWCESQGRVSEWENSINVATGDITMSKVFYDYKNYLDSMNKTAITGSTIKVNTVQVINYHDNVNFKTVIDNTYMEYNVPYTLKRDMVRFVGLTEKIVVDQIHIDSNILGTLIVSTVAGGVEFSDYMCKTVYNVTNGMSMFYLYCKGACIYEKEFDNTQEVISLSWQHQITFDGAGNSCEEIVSVNRPTLTTSIQYNEAYKNTVQQGQVIKANTNTVSDFPTSVGSTNVGTVANVAPTSNNPLSTQFYPDNWVGTFKDCSPVCGSYTFTSAGTGTMTGEMDYSRTGTWVGDWSWTNTGARTWTGTYTAADATTWEGTAVETQTSSISDPTGNINWEPLKISGMLFTTKFPFSLPWDLLKTFQALLIDKPTPPIWDINWHDSVLKKDFGFKLDLSRFDTIFKVARVFVLISLMVGLIMVTRKLLGGAT